MSTAALESEVRSYCRTWPTTFTCGRGSYLHDESGRAFLDFFMGAGALNYGHNHPVLKAALMDYLEHDGVVHSLDMATSAKTGFLREFKRQVLDPRHLDYRVQFCGPTGANCVEAALKLARKVTGRPGVVAFTGAFHGMSLGALAVTGNAFKRAGAGIALGGTCRLPYDGFSGAGIDGISLLDALLADSSSGIDRPAAVIVETVQGEGGINVAGRDWLARLAALCAEREILLIVDDVQMGCGRTGEFFSFEEAGITPDIVCLSKSISGFGLPMALALFRPELDIWAPGEHNGTFRGHNPAFVTATAALREFWADGILVKQTAEHAELVRQGLADIAERHHGAGARYRGRGLVWGLEFEDTDAAARVSTAAFARGLLVETSGSADEVVKLLPPLTASAPELTQGLQILGQAVAAAL
jgi:diaminobutyrate-2-oxoglutarate transaminase